MYRSIRNNETNKASQLTVMGMWGKVLEWEVASKTMLFRLRSGNRLGANKAFQDKLREAQTIISQTRTNFVPLRAVSAGVDTPLTPLADFVKMTPFQAVETNYAFPARGSPIAAHSKGRCGQLFGRVIAEGERRKENRSFGVSSL